ncbi:hypothetical protein [Paracoccus homiensis]|uniref:hypothetical protein n=1 Tax=Paracoccus homiensis TaxID=364199 RepID=UPI00398C9A10
MLRTKKDANTKKDNRALRSCFIKLVQVTAFAFSISLISPHSANALSDDLETVIGYQSNIDHVSALKVSYFLNRLQEHDRYLKEFPHHRNVYLRDGAIIRSHGEALLDFAQDLLPKIDGTSLSDLYGINAGLGVGVGGFSIGFSLDPKIADDKWRSYAFNPNTVTENLLATIEQGDLPVNAALRDAVIRWYSLDIQADGFDNHPAVQLKSLLEEKDGGDERIDEIEEQIRIYVALNEEIKNYISSQEVLEAQQQRIQEIRTRQREISAFFATARSIAIIFNEPEAAELAGMFLEISTLIEAARTSIENNAPMAAANAYVAAIAIVIDTFRRLDAATKDSPESVLLKEVLKQLHTIREEMYLNHLQLNARLAQFFSQNFLVLADIQQSLEEIALKVDNLDEEVQELGNDTRDWFQALDATTFRRQTAACFGLDGLSANDLTEAEFRECQNFYYLNATEEAFYNELYREDEFSDDIYSDLRRSYPNARLLAFSILNDLVEVHNASLPEDDQDSKLSPFRTNLPNPNIWDINSFYLAKLYADNIEHVDEGVSNRLHGLAQQAADIEDYYDSLLSPPSGASRFISLLRTWRAQSDKIISAAREQELRSPQGFDLNLAYDQPYHFDPSGKTNQTVKACGGATAYVDQPHFQTGQIAEVPQLSQQLLGEVRRDSNRLSFTALWDKIPQWAKNFTILRSGARLEACLLRVELKTTAFQDQGFSVNPRFKATQKVARFVIQYELIWDARTNQSQPPDIKRVVVSTQAAQVAVDGDRSLWLHSFSTVDALWKGSSAGSGGGQHQTFPVNISQLGVSRIDSWWSGATETLDSASIQKAVAVVEPISSARLQQLRTEALASKAIAFREQVEYIVRSAEALRVIAIVQGPDFLASKPLLRQFVEDPFGNVLGVELEEIRSGAFPPLAPIDDAFVQGIQTELQQLNLSGAEYPWQVSYLRETASLLQQAVLADAECDDQCLMETTQKSD